jgi:hypothetical protein
MKTLQLKRSLLETLSEVNMKLEDLYTSFGWITFLFPDGSRRVVHTTFNADVLKDVLKDQKEGQIFDLKKSRWINSPTHHDVSIEITAEEPEMTDAEKFVHQFL